MLQPLSHDLGKGEADLKKERRKIKSNFWRQRRGTGRGLFSRTKGRGGVHNDGQWTIGERVKKEQSMSSKKWTLKS